ncbi:MAG: tRNA (N(6)-L-threonylcarbamoyladenosine(37)-C(2))-methylthiotransferase MtaB [Gemmataceae bacterium]
MEPRRARLVTLGCKVNQYETQYVKELLEHAGWIEAADDEPADLCLVNTCTVTHEGDAKSRQVIRRLHQAQPGAEVVVMGCYATRDPAAVARLPGVSQVITDKLRLVDELAPFGVVSPLPGISRFDGHQRAFVKVQDGCLLNCAFCIIPSVRPVVRSRPAAEIADEVLRLVEAGYREVVLTGIHLGHYGIDLSKGRPRDQWTRLWHLLDRLAALPGDFRIRLSSLEAAEARDDLIRALAQHPRLCPHLHLCLQSGSDRILSAMRRRYTRQGFLDRIARIRTQLDEPAFSTDVIVGFPGETDADFADTCATIRAAGLTSLHVFSYSPRQGTTAATLPDDVPPSVKSQRRETLHALERELAAAYHARLIGRTLDVLVESADPTHPAHVRGTSCRYAQVSFPGTLTLRRQRVRVRITHADATGLRGVPEHTSARQPLPLA